jgi:hypothetical protein
VSLNDHPLSVIALGKIFLNPSDRLSTTMGKAGILLKPGIFLRIGDNSQIRMISASLIDVQLELSRGEAILEVDELLRDNNIRMLDHGGVVAIQKPGLYRIIADNPPSAAAITGKIEIPLVGE